VRHLIGRPAAVRSDCRRALGHARSPIRLVTDGRLADIFALEQHANERGGPAVERPECTVPLPAPRTSPGTPSTIEFALPKCLSGLRERPASRRVEELWELLDLWWGGCDGWGGQGAGLLRPAE